MSVNFSQTEYELLYLINKVRTDREFFIPSLEAHLKCFKGNSYKIPGTHINVITEEGPQAVVEAINYLRWAPSCLSLMTSRGLTQSARDHAEDIGLSGRTSHEGGDGSRMSERIERYGEWDNSIAENIVFDDIRAEDLLVGMLVDDGNRTKGHRHNILNPDFKFVGISFGNHVKHKFVTVVNFAVSYEEKLQEISRKVSESKKEVYTRKTMADSGKVMTDNKIESQKSIGKVEQVDDSNEQVFYKKSTAKGDAGLPLAKDYLVDNSNKQIRTTEFQQMPLVGLVGAAPIRKAEGGMRPMTKKVKSNKGNTEVGLTKEGDWKEDGQSEDVYQEYQFKNGEVDKTRLTDTGSRLPGRSGYVEYASSNDPDWPENGENVRVRTHIKVLGNRRVYKFTKKYFLKNGEMEIVENVEHESLGK